MTATSFNPLTAARDLEAAGIERQQAEAIASQLRDAATAEREDLVTKTDLTNAIAGLRSDMRWMFGFQAALILAIAAPSVRARLSHRTSKDTHDRRPQARNPGLDRPHADAIAEQLRAAAGAAWQSSNRHRGRVRVDHPESAAMTTKRNPPTSPAPPDRAPRRPPESPRPKGTASRAAKREYSYTSNQRWAGTQDFGGRARHEPAGDRPRRIRAAARGQLAMIGEQPRCELWPGPEPRQRALFGPARDGTLVLLETGRVRDPRELAIRPRVAQHCRLATVEGRSAIGIGWTTTTRASAVPKWSPGSSGHAHSDRSCYPSGSWTSASRFDSESPPGPSGSIWTQPTTRPRPARRCSPSRPPSEQETKRDHQRRPACAPLAGDAADPARERGDRARPASDLVFQHTVLCQTALPYRALDTRLWQRRNGQVELEIEAGRVRDPAHHRWIPVPLPYEHGRA